MSTQEGQNWIRDRLATVQETLGMVARKVREISESQVSLWQKVPYLALQADGRTGYLDQYSRAYLQGYWAIESSIQGSSYAVYVDLETGSLRNGYAPQLAAVDKEIVRINLNELDAETVTRQLRELAKQPINALFYNQLVRANWRKVVAAQLGLESNVYKRPKSSPVGP